MARKRSSMDVKTRYTLILPVELLARVRAQADREGLDVAKFMRQILAEATKNVHVRTEDPVLRRQRMARRRT